MESNGRTTVNKELETVWKEAVESSVKKLSQNLAGVTGKIQGKSL
jgi:hypothetical protein